jgi:hypothetical protein
MCLTLILLLGWLTPTALAQQATGPLFHPANGRYFTDGSGKAIYLTGTHTWTNLVDRGPSDPPPAFDYTAYLDFMQQHNHNFMRMWAWENTLTTIETPTGTVSEYYDPHPYLRTGPDLANDGLPKFDLDQFNQAYFNRLRDRVILAGQRGIYVSVMLFQGWSVWNYGSNRQAWYTSYFNRDNNVNGIDGDLNDNDEGEEVHSLAIPAALARQRAYVMKVIDTLNDLDNVLYEISNESHLSSQAWQAQVDPNPNDPNDTRGMIQFIQNYQNTKPQQHPVGMTAFGDSVNNAPLFGSSATWISPHSSGFGGASETYAGTIPAADGSKVSILDTDHIGWDIFINDAAYTRSWVWRAFLAGHNPILMEDLSASAGWMAGRAAMGHTRTYATKMNLAAMTPRGDLSSTGHCLANPGSEYLAYQPGPGQMRITLASGAYAVEWFNTVTGAKQTAPSVKGNGRPLNFKAPFAHAALYLKRLP